MAESKSVHSKNSDTALEDFEAMSSGSATNKLGHCDFRIRTLAIENRVKSVRCGTVRPLSSAEGRFGTASRPPDRGPAAKVSARLR
jgi:hypothetical protein